MDEHNDESTPGQSRRDLIKKGAAIGGVIWAVPVIESFTNRAAAAHPGSPLDTNPGNADISYLALMIQCGTSCTKIKFEVDEVTGVGPAICGDIGSTPFCTAMVGCTGGPSCTTLPTAVLDANGYVWVTIPDGCTLVDFRVKCGNCCEGPNSEGQPTSAEMAAGTHMFSFNRCTGNGGGFACEPSAYIALAPPPPPKKTPPPKR